MYQSKKSIAYLPTQLLRKRFLEFLKKYKKIRCHGLSRPLFFCEAENILQRKDVKQRLESFFVGVDIIRKSSDFTQSTIDGSVRYEFIGIAKGGKLVKTHLKEKKLKGDKKVFFISSFYKKIASLP